ncbi:Type I restriction modification DNA specificity domain [Mycobacteroides abscessus subsp. abscessus]|nr:Type I restriction modification DNA specificity domain [Mycobacteroides abscessus subsp. abscessus]
MTEHTNTPELRFSEFKEEWKLQKLGNLAQFSKGKSLSKKDLNINGNPCILYGELYTKYGAILNKVYSKTSTQNDSLVFSKRNQILIPSSGETDIDIATATAIDTDVKIAIGGDLNIITPINSDGRFISLYINGKGKYNLAKYAQGKSVVHLYNSDIKKLNFYLPPNMAEQKKISDFFSKLDRQIELEEEKLELLEQQKRGYMQKIFSQELRIKDEKGNDYPKWIFKKFEEIFKVIPSKKYQIKSSEIEDNASIPVIDQGQNLILGFSNNKEKVFTDFKNVIIYGDHTTVIKRSDKPFIIGGDGVKLLTSKVDSDISYLYNALQYFNVKSEGYKRHFSILKNKDFYISTSIEEQKRIANIFNKLDKYIGKQFAKVELLKQRKQGLLQKMFV